VAIILSSLYYSPTLLAQSDIRITKPVQSKPLYGPYNRFAQQATNSFRRTGSKKVIEATDEDAERLASIVLTGLLTERTALIGEKGEAAIFSLGTHSGIFRTAFNFAKQITSEPIRYLDNRQVKCPGGGNYQSRATSTPSKNRGEEGVSSITVSLEMSDCVLSDPLSWIDHPSMTPAREYYERAVYNGELHVYATYDKTLLVQSLRAYEKFTATAEKDEIILTGAEILALPTHCADDNQQVSTVHVEQRGGDSLLYNDFIFLLTGLASDDSVCSTVDRPVNSYEGTLSHSAYGTLEVSTSAPLPYRLDPRTLQLHPIREKEQFKDLDSNGALQLRANDVEVLSVAVEMKDVDTAARPSSLDVVTKNPQLPRPALTIGRTSRLNNLNSFP